MSRIGKAPVSFDKSVNVSITGDQVSVKGPKGELFQKVSPLITVTVEENQVIVARSSDDKQERALHGLTRALINNMVEGVTKGFTVSQELVGVGYRASHQGQVLDLSLGYSHNIVFQLPKEVKLNTVTERGKNPTIQLESIDKQLIGHIAAKIRSFRSPEPYKGKGIRFTGEQVRKKAGKSAGK